MKAEQKKKNITLKAFIAVLLTTLVITSVLANISVLAESDTNNSEESLSQSELAETAVKTKVEKLEKVKEVIRERNGTISYMKAFSATGFIMNENESGAEPIRIIASKGKPFPIAMLKKFASENVVEEIRQVLTESEQTIQTTTKPNIWSGILSVGLGEQRRNYALVGKETNNEIEFSVIPLREYPVVINKMSITRKTFPRIEIWEGSLDLQNSGKGIWKLTAFSYRIARVPVPLEIKKGEPVKVRDYVIKQIATKRARLFGLIPVGKQFAIVKIYRKDKPIAEKKLSENEVAEIGNLTLRVVKINGKLKVIAETKETESEQIKEQTQEIENLLNES